MVESSSLSPRATCRRSSGRPRPFLLALALPALAPNAACGDQVVAGGVNYPGAAIVTLEGGRLQFRTAAGKLQAVWVSDVDLLIVDRGGLFADVNQAERHLAGGEPAKAIERYRRALKRIKETLERST